MGNSAKTIALIVLALEQRGIVNMINQAPLQLEVLKPDATDLASYEKVLLGAIQEDGTLDKNQIPAVLEAVSQVVQPKMWNADPKATRETYQRRIDTAWEEYERDWRTRPPTAPMPNYVPWIILNDRVWQHGSSGGGDLAAGSAGPGSAGPGSTGCRRPHRTDGRAPPPRGSRILSAGTVAPDGNPVSRASLEIPRPAMTRVTRPATVPATRLASTMLATRPASMMLATVPATQPACAIARATVPATRPCV